MARSLKIQPEYLDSTKSALKRTGFGSQKALAKQLGLSLSTANRFFNGKPVDYSNFVEIAQRLELDWQQLTGFGQQTVTLPTITTTPTTQDRQSHDWGEAIDVSVFFGRQEELALLQDWIVGDRCRLVALLGMGGMGKTALSIRLAQQIQDRFDRVVWRSLRNAPTVEVLLVDLLEQVSGGGVISESYYGLDQQIHDLLQSLRQQRCLLILDNWESILQSNTQVGQYRNGYDGYGHLLRSLGETQHQSCCMYTSREQPQGFARLTGPALPVRSLELHGVSPQDGQAIMKAKGQFRGTDSEWNRLVNHYAGNPLALKIVAAGMQDLFSDHIADFLDYLDQQALGFDDIDHLLSQQFGRLSEAEAEIMNWLAVEREPVSIMELSQNSLTPGFQPATALRALRQRSLIEKTATGFTQQSLTMEFVTRQLIQHFCNEIETGQVAILNQYFLLKAQGPDYLQTHQICTLVEPILQTLRSQFPTQSALESQLLSLMAKLQHHPQPGYATGNLLNLLCQLGTDLTGQDFSGSTLWQADLRGINLHQVNLAQADLSRTAFSAPLSIPQAIAFSPDGQFLAVGDATGVIYLYQIETWRLQFTDRGHQGWIWSLAFSPDAQLLASASEDHTLKLWDVATGQCLNTMQGHTDKVWAVTFSAEGEFLISASVDQTMRFWNLATGQCQRTIPYKHEQVRTLAFSPDSQLLATGGEDQVVRLWRVTTGECCATLTGHQIWVRSVAFSPDGRRLVTGGEDQTIQLWDLATRQCRLTLAGHTSRVGCIAFSPDGQTLASGGEDQIIKLWEISSGTCQQTLHQHQGWIWALQFSPDGQVLVSGSGDQSFKVWDTATGLCLHTIRGQSQWSQSLALSPDGQCLASGGGDHTIKLWDLMTPDRYRTFRGHQRPVFGVAFNPDGQTLASCSEDQTIRLWDLQTGQCQQICRGHTSWVWDVAYSPDGHALATTSEDQTIKLWNPKSGHCERTLSDNQSWVCAIAFSPDSQILASGHYDQIIKLWDISTGDCRQVLQGHQGWIWSVAFSPDGQYLASGSGDQTIKVWHLETGRCERTLTGHTGQVWTIAFSPVTNDHKQLLLASGSDREIKLWNLLTGECLQTLQGDANLIRSLAFSPDGQILYSASQDETLRFWKVTSGQCLKTLKVKRLYEGMKIQDARGLTDAQTITLKALGAVD